MSLYAKLEKQNVPLQFYIKNIKKLFLELVHYAPEWKNKALFPDDILDKRPLFILVSTSKGLCGSLNSNLFRYFEHSYVLDKSQKPSFITVGKKATKYVQEKLGGDIICSYAELNSSNYMSIASDLMDKIITTDKPFSSVVFFSNFLKTFFVQEAKKSTLIPFAPDFDDQQSNQESEELIEEFEKTSPHWEQKTDAVLDYLADLYVRSFIMNLLYQAFIAEQAARFVAMDSSTNNADKFLEKLTLQYNKQRQSLITREVSELSATGQ